MTVGAAVGSLVVAVISRRRSRSGDEASWTAAAPVALPVGAALGWLGPTYVGEGLATAALVWIVIRAVRHVRPPAAPDRVRGVLGIALASGVVVATVIAVAVGARAGT